MEPDFTLADDLIAVMGNPKRGLAHQFRTSTAKEAMRIVRDAVRSSRKFVLDDELVQFAARMATLITPEQCISLIRNYVRCPFPNNWIEWDEITRVEAISQTIADHPDRFQPEIIERSKKFLDEGPNGPLHQSQARRVGYHVADPNQIVGYRATLGRTAPLDGGPRMESPYLVGQCFYVASEGPDSPEILMGSPIGFTVKMETGYTKEEDRMRGASFLGRIPTQEELEKLNSNDTSGTLNILSDWWWSGKISPGKWGEHGKYKEDEVPSDVMALIGHIRPIQTHAVHWLINTESGFNADDLRKVSRLGMSVCEGDPRFILTVMALLNHDWIVKEPTQRMQGSRRQWGSYVKGNAYHVISIDLPKNRGVEVTMKSFAESKTQRRYHEVRGHWMFIKKSKKRVWRTSCHRGDPALGVITHDYELTKGDSNWRGSKHVKKKAI